MADKSKNAPEAGAEVALPPRGKAPPILVIVTTVLATLLVVTVVLLIGTVFIVMRSVARMFLAGELISGEPFSAKRYFRALFGRS